ncbi:uncharacterized protein LOC112466918, partial [Temnothorax curvispinosus]|uniref:Uncharacterized protein LOC112466918 n=1 Tax=Temnothorax curvispinosus TaxID=300111 RepID=A0A6J1RDU2_9HYME
TDVLLQDKVELRIKKGIFRISADPEPFSELPTVNSIDYSDKVIEPAVEHIENPEARDRVKRLVSEYKPLKTQDVGIELNIVLKDETPVYRRANRISETERKTLDEQIRKWLDEGIIQQSTSEYASPAVLVKKKNGTTRRYINAVFAKLVAEKKVSLYMDDLIIPSSDVQEGLQYLEEVLRTASSYGLEINWGKCQLLKTRVDYLGFIIENGDVTPSDEKTSAVKNFPVPTDKKTVQSFLGLTG